MTDIDAAVAEFQKTILELGIRLANYAIQNESLKQQIATLNKTIDEMKSAQA